MATMKYIATPMAVSIHSETDNPVFGETSIHVSVEDEAGGPFICIKHDDQTISMDLPALELVLIEARKLINAHDSLESK